MSLKVNLRRGGAIVVAALVATAVGVTPARAAAPHGVGTMAVAGADKVVLSGNRIGVLANGVVLVKEGALNAPWVTEYTNAADLAMDGNRIAVLTRDSKMLVKQGSLNAAWVTERTDASEIALSTDRIGVVTKAGKVLVKAGTLSAPWVTEYTADQVVLSGNRIGVVIGSRVLVKEGDLWAPWNVVATDAAYFTMSANRIGMVTTKWNHAEVKEGALTNDWALMMVGAETIVLDDARIGVTTDQGSVLVKQGATNAQWVTVASEGMRLALGGGRVGMLTYDGTVLVKEGGLSTGWVRV
jgi:hypothetical protein